MREITVICALAVSIIGLLFIFEYWNESSKCSTFKELTGASTNVSLNAGCLVKMDGRWLTIESATSNVHDITVKQASASK